jgi:hypothetical protein
LRGAVLATRKAASAEARLRPFDGGRRIVERERSRWLRHSAWVVSPRHARRSLALANGGVYIGGLMWRHGGGDCGEIPLEDARENELSAREGSQVLDSYPVGSGANREQISQRSTATRLTCSRASTCDGRPVHRTSGSRAARSSLGGGERRRNRSGAGPSRPHPCPLGPQDVQGSSESRGTLRVCDSYSADTRDGNRYSLPPSSATLFIRLRGAGPRSEPDGKTTQRTSSFTPAC